MFAWEGNFMKRILSVISVLTAVLLALSAVACAQPAEVSAASETAAAEPAQTTAAPTATPTEAPTPEPTPSPTPEPVFVETPLMQELIRRSGIIVTATELHFSKDYAAYVDLTIENASKQPVAVSSEGVYLNDWHVESVLENADAIQPGEIRSATLSVVGLSDPSAAYMGISELASFSCDLSAVNAETNETLWELSDLSLELSSAAQAVSPADGAELIYEDNNLAVYLQGIDGSLASVRAILYRKESAVWKSATVDPVYAGYTNLVNGTYALDAGKYQLLALDGSEVMSAHGISQLAELKLYITLNLHDGRILRPVIATIMDPAGTETIASSEESGPVVYESKLAYCILRYMGIIQFQGHEAILLDYENITQNYIKLLDLTAMAAVQVMKIDSTEYPVATYCTYSFPTTHGYIMVWPDGAPDGTLSSASTADLRLRLARINAGHLDPILDTGWFTVDLTAK